jgi:hypothetical protein
MPYLVVQMFLLHSLTFPVLLKPFYQQSQSTSFMQTQGGMMGCLHTGQLQLKALSQLMAQVCTQIFMQAQHSEQRFCSHY